MSSLQLDHIYTGDALDTLRTLPDGVVNCVVTSPPYFGLRDYGVVGQIGLEHSMSEYIGKLVALFREIRRVLRVDGTVWVNLGDTYTGGGRGCNPPLSKYWKQGTNAGSVINNRTEFEGLPGKSLCMIPARVAIAMQDDGWILRSEIVWSKPNPMPESVTDRPTKAHEMIYLFAKSPRYFYDADAIQERLSREYTGTSKDGGLANRTAMKHSIIGNQANGSNLDLSSRLFRNARSVWTIATQPTPHAHFATFPQELVRRCILAGSPLSGIVLDPFMGSGTTALVARLLNRRYVGIELNPAYVAIAEKRLAQPYQLSMEYHTATA